MKIPPRYADCTLDNYQTDTKSTQAALEAAQSFLDNIEPGNGLLLRGPVGTGKTHLACALLKAPESDDLSERLFVDYGELLTAVQAMYGTDKPETEVLGPAMDADLLILDDLGTRRPTDWSKDMVANVLGHRYNYCKPTIVTTNYGERALSARIGKRMVSRLKQMCRWVEITGKDWREG